MILVLGVGRSGTSDVARILDELGVNMGHRFHSEDEFNPKGYFEDKDFQELNMTYTMMGLYKKDRRENLYKIWRKQFNEMLAKREEPWGLKDPGIADFPALLDEYLKLDPKIVVCSRDKDDTIRSLQKFKQLGKRAEDIYNNRLNNLKTALRGKEYTDIDCYDIYKEKELKKLI